MTNKEILSIITPKAEAATGNLFDSNKALRRFMNRLNLGVDLEAEETKNNFIQKHGMSTYVEVRDWSFNYNRETAKLLWKTFDKDGMDAVMELKKSLDKGITNRELLSR